MDEILCTVFTPKLLTSVELWTTSVYWKSVCPSVHVHVNTITKNSIRWIHGVDTDLIARIVDTAEPPESELIGAVDCTVKKNPVKFTVLNWQLGWLCKTVKVTK
ncbi:hypothetical protein AVEN_79110-1 [Araneus ventricosus]|uniref:Uncharacterized protein n=1 Tax=Araneus ventricosus TaxID=182803 RepID=A0A4Y2IKP3_ARAVE|nr:hypothetical protein AVEN_79110-1 [Araneus ventricosus]